MKATSPEDIKPGDFKGYLEKSFSYSRRGSMLDMGLLIPFWNTYEELGKPSLSTVYEVFSYKFPCKAALRATFGIPC